jgi:hypothetical protein
MSDVVMNEVVTDTGGGGGGASAGAMAGTLLASQTTSQVATPSAGSTASATPPPTVSIPDNWKDALPAEFKDEPSLKAIGDVQTLVKSYIHSQKMVGKNKLTIPDQHATEDDWRQFYHKIGLPQKFEEYNFEIPKDAQFEDGFVTQLKDQAYKAGILPKQMGQLVDWYSKANNEALKAMEQKQQAEVQERIGSLKQEWGQAFNQKVQMAQRALKATGLGGEVFDWLNETGLGDEPMLIKLFAALGEMVKEDTLGDADVGQALTPKELQGRINEILGDKAHPVHQKTHPNHGAAVEELQTLFKQLHPANNV